jgi:hypothetical protein
MAKILEFTNPFRPGAGHRPPYLAGRKHEESEFRKAIKQTVILENLILTGLRGVGKTVLLESFKPIALQEGWLWVGTDLSESASVSEENMAQRVITDLSVVTRNIYIGTPKQMAFGFTGEPEEEQIPLGYETLWNLYVSTPGLVADKLKAVLLYVHPYIRRAGRKGIVFSYDESQNLSDHKEKDQYPLSLLLEVFQSIQRQNVPFLLLLAGLPTLFQRLVESRTYAERMFSVITLKRLADDESRDAIAKPISDANCPVSFAQQSIDLIVNYSGGYPYFIQFMCKEAYDAWLQRTSEGKEASVPIKEITRKLDNDFFAGRWNLITDRQQKLLFVIAHLDTRNDEFTIKEIMTKAKEIPNATFGKSQISQMLTSLTLAGLVYKDRHGKYVFAVPLLADFIKRTMTDQP